MRATLRQIVEPDREHIHHRMLAMGWSVRRTVLVLYGVTAILSALALATADVPDAMKRVLLVQPSMQPPGGGNGVAAWVLQALVAEHHHAYKVPCCRGGRLRSSRSTASSARICSRSDFDTIEVPRSWRVVADHLPTPSTLIKLSLLMRYTRRVSAGFDVVFGVHNETDFGRRGIQYVHYPTYLRPRPRSISAGITRPQSGLNLYYALADRIADFSLDRTEGQSHARQFRLDRRARLDVSWHQDADAVSARLSIRRRALPWSERRNAFLAVGRISPEKEYERVMKILARVRERAPDITLTIVGTRDRHARRYFRLAHVTGRVAGIVDRLSRQPHARRGARR